jgi:hypothetical protein
VGELAPNVFDSIKRQNQVERAARSADERDVPQQPDPIDHADRPEAEYAEEMESGE